MISIIDYGAGNMRSVERALNILNIEFRLISEARDLDLTQSRGFILPGVGAAADTMAALEKKGLTDPIRDLVVSGRPFLGVCMGLQVLYESSEEDGGTDCLGIFPGIIRRFSDGLHVPHMGWNQVVTAKPTRLLEGIPSGSNFYFVHSYYACKSGITAATTDYGIEFESVLTQENVYATQFHPEKSGKLGLQIYSNFASICGIAHSDE
tara:strand:- start:649 stop:1272 length:624 start_codon:yes stop_codon:yes gene_type:complete